MSSEPLESILSSEASMLEDITSSLFDEDELSRILSSFLGSFLSIKNTPSSSSLYKKREPTLLTPEEIGNLRFDECDIEKTGNILKSLVTDVPFLEKPPYIKVKIKKLEGYPGELSTLASLLDNNNAIFDAILYIRALDQSRIKVTTGDMSYSEKVESSLSIHDFEKSLFIIYLLLMIRGRIPEDYEKLPSIVIPLLGNTSLKKHKARVFSFRISKMDISWIKKINISNFGELTREYLISNVAGYRQMAVFSKIKPSATLSDSVRVPYNAVVNFYAKGPTWDMYPLTRTTRSVLEVGGNLYQNLINLVFKVYSEEEIDLIKKEKWIPRCAEYDKSIHDFWWWNDETFEPFTDYIFKV